MVRNALYKKNAGVKLPQIWDKNTPPCQSIQSKFAVHFGCTASSVSSPFAARGCCPLKAGASGSLCDELIHQQGPVDVQVEREEGVWTRVKLNSILLGCCTLQALTGCGDMPGRIRAKVDQVVGIYESRFDNGHARLKLKADGTYFHEFSLAHRSIRHTDRCETKNYFLDGDGS